MRVSNYEVDNVVLGKGAFGVVSLGKHMVSNQKVAIKAVETKLLNAEQKRTLEIEVEALARVAHPNVVALLDVVRTPDTEFLILEYCDAGDVFDYLSVHGCLKEGMAAKVFAQLASGLAACHASGVAHRDLKLENVLLSGHDLNVKINDFGLACLFCDGQRVTEKCGTPGYAPPEVVSLPDLPEARAMHGYDPRLADVWSLGVVLFAMLVGALPFGDSLAPHDVASLMDADRVIVEILEDLDFVPVPAASLLRGILHKEPEARLNLSQILAHPWVTPHVPDTPKPQSSVGRLRAATSLSDFSELILLGKHASASSPLAMPSNSRSGPGNGRFGPPTLTPSPQSIQLRQQMLARRRRQRSSSLTGSASLIKRINSGSGMRPPSSVFVGARATSPRDGNTTGATGQSPIFVFSRQDSGTSFESESSMGMFGSPISVLVPSASVDSENVSVGSTDELNNILDDVFGQMGHGRIESPIFSNESTHHSPAMPFPHLQQPALLPMPSGGSPSGRSARRRSIAVHPTLESNFNNVGSPVYRGVAPALMGIRDNSPPAGVFKSPSDALQAIPDESAMAEWSALAGMVSGVRSIRSSSASSHSTQSSFSSTGSRSHCSSSSTPSYSDSESASDSADTAHERPDSDDDNDAAGVFEADISGLMHQMSGDQIANNSCGKPSKYAMPPASFNTTMEEVNLVLSAALGESTKLSPRSPRPRLTPRNNGEPLLTSRSSKSSGRNTPKVVVGSPVLAGVHISTPSSNPLNMSFSAVNLHETSAAADEALRAPRAPRFAMAASTTSSRTPIDLLKYVGSKLAELSSEYVVEHLQWTFSCYHISSELGQLLSGEASSSPAQTSLDNIMSPSSLMSPVSATPLAFTIEICLVRNLALSGLKFRRLQGSPWEYKRRLGELLEHVGLANEGSAATPSG
ncbi:SADB-short [Thecamonas trahens ATCC 50062]|uniref:non-specific serine/threonine protein kinase n=1 Tax=Thecamonas trahens ATCC 50062 TaxID=461836 RepID=A0A0L0DIJ0_THETB|nr:SADB-short [Thecamonas trahens ATCC 50062]KNC51143.1 SADB-short [Thecamonas trahens ATCC 50062]|eukprot:XP_013756346.1 SADB-short [Thecamonas trahens ATCC 50062]